jgi:hypothetical protein
VTLLLVGSAEAARVVAELAHENGLGGGALDLGKVPAPRVRASVTRNCERPIMEVSSLRACQHCGGRVEGAPTHEHCAGPCWEPWWPGSPAAEAGS